MQGSDVRPERDEIERSRRGGGLGQEGSDVLRLGGAEVG